MRGRLRSANDCAKRFSNVAAQRGSEPA
ncbi:hypothetical protein GGQ85_001984, partial [Nitrobacter vulgaris]|nr:hypothetical protein [Nitrobacter vulgaris]